jgi:hypothetical protein
LCSTPSISFIASGFGAAAAYAIDRPSGDHRKRDTPVSTVVNSCASPPVGSIR